MITVTTNPSQTTEPKSFPKLMIASKSKKCPSRIVFFINETDGICIDTGELKNIKAGAFRESWDIDCFEDYNEPITLQNV